eukprot:643015-Prymnesium_polylepis.2
MPDELYEAGQRVKFAARMDGRFTDLKYLIRLCSNEVYFRSKRARCPLQRSSVRLRSAATTSSYSRRAAALTRCKCVGTTAMTHRAARCSSAMTRSGAISALTKADHASVTHTTRSGRLRPSTSIRTAERDEHGANESPPFRPKPVPKPSDADIKKYKDILAKRNKDRKGKRDEDKP